MAPATAATTTTTSPTGSPRSTGWSSVSSSDSWALVLGLTSEALGLLGHVFIGLWLLDYGALISIYWVGVLGLTFGRLSRPPRSTGWFSVSSSVPLAVAFGPTSEAVLGLLGHVDTVRRCNGHRLLWRDAVPSTGELVLL